MIVTLRDAKTLGCKFPYSASAMTKVKALLHRTYDAANKTWLVSVGDFELLAAAFPDLQASEDAWEAAYPSWDTGLDIVLTFCPNLAALGVSIVEQDGRIAAVGGSVSPLLQAKVDARADLMRRLLDQRWEFQAMENKSAGEATGPWLAGAGRVEPQAAPDGVTRPLANAAATTTRCLPPSCTACATPPQRCDRGQTQSGTTQGEGQSITNVLLRS